MSSRQILVVCLCLLINAIDGFDVQVTAFTAAAVAADWSLRPDVLGIVLSAGLIGMAFGALFLSSIADVYGRKPLIVGSLIIVAVGMLLSSFCTTVTQLAVTRVFTGIGIGGLISSVGTLVSEYSPDRRRGLVLGLMAISFPAGAMLCAAISIPLIGRFGWESVFVAGAVFTALVIPIVIWFMPESVMYLLSSPRANDQLRLTKTLRIFGIETPVAVMPSTAIVRPSISLRYRHLLTGDLRGRTARLGGLFLCAMLTFYYILNWVPKLAVQAGAPMSGGATLGLLVNLGGVGGGVIAGLVMPRLGLTWTGRIALVAMAAAVALVSYFIGQMTVVMPLAVMLGFTLWAVQACIYTAMMIAFPAHVRATAVGLVTTAGRVGSALGPLLGGVLLNAGQSPLVTSLILIVPALLGTTLIADYASKSRES